MSETELKRIFQAIQDCGDVQHEISLELLFYTAIRVSELVRIEVNVVDLDRCKIFINQGKGAKDRYILFPASFHLALKSQLSDAQIQLISGQRSEKSFKVYQHLSLAGVEQAYQEAVRNLNH